MTRLLAALIATLLTVAPMGAAITFTAGDDINWGDLATDSNLTELTAAITVNLTGIATAERFMGHYDHDAEATRSWLMLVDDNDEIALLMASGSATSSNWYGKVTTVTNLTAGNLYRICATLDAANNQGAIYVNGVAQTIATRGDSANTSATTGNSSAVLFVGENTASSGTPDGVDGDYSEAAVWNRGGTEMEPLCEAYGKGFAPSMFQQGLLWYAPLHNGSHLRDHKGGLGGSGSGIANAAGHPAMFYPAP